MQIRNLTLAAVIVALSVAGCTAPTVEPSKSPTPSAAPPVFASEAEALEAARVAYASYLEVSDAILADGGADPERLLSVATDSVLANQQGAYSTASESGLRTVGTTSVDSVNLQHVDLLTGTVVVYACVDVSQVDVLDSSGKSVVSPSRPTRTPFEAKFETIDQTLKLGGEEVWSGDDFC